MGAPKKKTRAERDAAALEMKALEKQGLSYREIGEKFGVGASTVGYYLTTRKTALKHSSKGVVSVLGGPTDTGSETTGFAAGFISGWLGSYASRHNLDAAALTLDVVAMLKKEVR